MHLLGAAPLIRFIIDSMNDTEVEPATIIHLESQSGEQLFCLHFSLCAQTGWNCTIITHTCHGKHLVNNTGADDINDFDIMAANIASLVLQSTDELLIIRGIFI